MDNPATTADLVARGYVLPEGSPVPKTRLDEAWRALRRNGNAPWIVTALQAGWVTSDDVIDVVAAAALRVLDNPAGVEQESSGIDDYTESRKLANATKDIYFTSAELRGLTPPTPTAGSLKYS